MVDSLPTKGGLVKKKINTQIKMTTKLDIEIFEIKKILAPIIDIETKRLAKNMPFITM